MSVSRRAIIITLSIVVAVTLVVILLVVSISSSGDEPRASVTNSGPATYTGAPTVRPSATPGAGTATVDPTEIPAAGTQDVPGSVPSATADASAASGLAQKPTGFTSTARLTSQVSVSLVDVKSVSGKGDGVGEVSGPAVLFTLKIENGSSKELDLTSTVVNLTYGVDATPSAELSSQRKRFPNSVAAGKTVTATFTFPIPTKERSDVRITVDYGVSVPTVVFEGKAPA